jgi:hypothetical protein
VAPGERHHGRPRFPRNHPPRAAAGLSPLHRRRRRHRQARLCRRRPRSLPLRGALPSFGARRIKSLTSASTWRWSASASAISSEMYRPPQPWAEGPLLAGALGSPAVLCSTASSRQASSPTQRRRAWTSTAAGSGRKVIISEPATNQDGDDGRDDRPLRFEIAHRGFIALLYALIRGFPETPRAVQTATRAGVEPARLRVERRAGDRGQHPLAGHSRPH